VKVSENKKINIAIDGYSSCGKSTLAKALAEKLAYIFIDTGAMYRAITLFCMRNKLISNDSIVVNQIESVLPSISVHFELNKETKKPEVFLNNENVEKEIRTMEVSSNVSKIATIKAVREKLVALQQKMGQNGGVVMDGRDIGSVVFPDAELKFFITADPDIRAKRRYLEINDSSVSLEDIKTNLKERDFIDTTREESPLIQVDDAIVIDNSNLNQEEQLDLALSYVNRKLKFC
jgi:CMP/dCMP kinase